LLVDLLPVLARAITAVVWSLGASDKSLRQCEQELTNHNITIQICLYLQNTIKLVSEKFCQLYIYIKFCQLYKGEADFINN